MVSLQNNRVIRFVNSQINRLRQYAQTNPKVALPLYVASALIIILLVSTIIAAIIQKDPQPTTDQQPVAQIQITKDGFIPATLVVKKGTKIIWTNADSKNHQLQANPHPTGESLPGLKSEILNNSQNYEYTADVSGTFGYHDHITPTINGTIEVQE